MKWINNNVGNCNWWLIMEIWLQLLSLCLWFECIMLIYHMLFSSLHIIVIWEFYEGAVCQVLQNAVFLLPYIWSDNVKLDFSREKPNSRKKRCISSFSRWFLIVLTENYTTISNYVYFSYYLYWKLHNFLVKFALFFYLYWNLVVVVLFLEYWCIFS